MSKHRPWTLIVISGYSCEIYTYIAIAPSFIYSRILWSVIVDYTIKWLINLHLRHTSFWIVKYEGIMLYYRNRTRPRNRPFLGKNWTAFKFTYNAKLIKWHSLSSAAPIEIFRKMIALAPLISSILFNYECSKSFDDFPTTGLWSFVFFKKRC